MEDSGARKWCASFPAIKTFKAQLALAFAAISCVCLCVSSSHQVALSGQSLALDEGKLALIDERQQLARRRRQTPIGSTQNAISRTSSQQQRSGSGSAASDATPAGVAGTAGDSFGSSADQEERPPEEVLGNLKCDFGTSEAPDLCKFRIIESENPLAKGLATWSLGSGKSALFQGGPLLDGSQGNDTNGGYIFYETSNPFAPAPPSQTANHTAGPQQHGFGGAFHHSNHDHSTFHAAMPSSQAQQQHNQRLTGYYSSDHQPQYPADRPLVDSSDQQTIASARISVGNGGGGGGGSSSSASLLQTLGPTFATPNLTAPGPSGMCLSFQYAIQGLSAEELRVHVLDQKTERTRQIWSATESAASNWTRGEVLYSANNKHALLFSATAGGPAGNARDPQQRRFRGYLALDELEVSRHDPLGAADGPCRGHCNFDGDLCGWTNADNVDEDNFDWSFGRGSDNLFTGPARDFTSSSNNELTGSYLFIDSGYPRRPGDRAVLLSPVFQPTQVNEAMCMRLAVHMFGSGIGSLAIKIRYLDEGAIASPGSASSPQQGGAGSGEPSAGSGGQASPSPDQTSANSPQGASSARANAILAATSFSGGAGDAKPVDMTIWEMSGDAGNNWHQAQTSVSSSRSPFQVLIEGVVGENHLGNMAIDEISFSNGPCPTSPPVASKNYGDCTFEQSMCYWRNPDADIHLDDLDWIRSADEQSIHGPNFDHTLKRRSGSYLKLENTLREPKSGTRAFLLSPIFQPKPSGSVQCLSFYYYMFMRSISSSGPNLGTMRVYLASNNELVPIWRLTNPISSPNWKHARATLSTALLDGQPVAPTKLFQIAFEGIWGDAVGGAIALDDITVFDGGCDIMPPEAKSVPGECTFDVDLCSWSNKTYEPMLSLTSDATDTNRSPFLQSVNSNNPAANLGARLTAGKRLGWQLATVDSRPVNLQDHTYKAPIGYTYVDVLDGGLGGGQPLAFPLQSAEATVQPGQQVATCLSFWFAAYGRQDNNQLSVYMTQASAPPPPPADEGGAGGPPPASSRPNQLAGGGGTPARAAQTGSTGSTTGVGNEPDGGEQSGAWRVIDGKLLWNISLRNITEANRRKWLYGQVTLRADSNHIVRFVGLSVDGGFALDDISYFEGPCETRPAQAKVVSADEETGGGSGGGGGGQDAPGKPQSAQSGTRPTS